MRRIVLHAGLPKTGTTSIQTAFHAQRRALLDEARLLYPSLDANLTNALCTLFHDDPRKQITNKLAGLTTLEAIAPLQRKYREALEREIESTEWDTLLLSAEGVSNLSPYALHRLREWGSRFATHWSVLLCVRHPVDYVRSLMQQLLKSGSTLAWLYDHLPLPGFRAKITNLITAFGRDNVAVFDFDSAREGAGGIVGAFAVRLRLSASIRDRLLAQEAGENPSLSREAVLLLDSVNRRRPMFDGEVRTPRRSGREAQYVRRVRGNRFEIPVALQDEIRARTRGDVEWLNAEFDLDLYPDVTGPRTHDTRQGEPAPKALDERTIDDLADVISELLTDRAYLLALEDGRNAFSQGDLETARKRFLEAQRLDPNASQPKAWLARLGEERGASTR